jgi:hypothetical protein
MKPMYEPQDLFRTESLDRKANVRIKIPDELRTETQILPQTIDGILINGFRPVVKIAIADEPRPPSQAHGFILRLLSERLKTAASRGVGCPRENPTSRAVLF